MGGLPRRLRLRTQSRTSSTLLSFSTCRRDILPILTKHCLAVERCCDLSADFVCELSHLLQVRYKTRGYIFIHEMQPLSSER